MSAVVPDGQFIAVHDEDEAQAIRRLQQAISHHDRAVQIATPDGQTLAIPESVYEALSQVVPVLARGGGVRLYTLPEELTLQEAADLLNVSIPFMVRLLEDGSIPSTNTETQARVHLSDVLAYRRKRSEQRNEALADMLALAQETGTYD